MLLCVMFVAAQADEPDAANLNAAKVDAAPAPAIKSWKPLPGEQLEVAGKKAFVIRPEKPAAGNPWLIYAPTFSGSLPAESAEGWMFERFLAAGIALAGVDSVPAKTWRVARQPGGSGWVHGAV